MNDPLLATALYLNDGTSCCLFVAVDVIWLSKQQVATARARIREQVGVPEQCILIGASHTHSGPSMVAILSNERDTAVPPPDPEVIATVLEGIVAAATSAVQRAEEAEIGFVDAPITGIGGNRHDPWGPSANTIQTMVVRSVATRDLIALQYVFNVHPTVLHEDSTLISGDFPGIARQILQSRFSQARPLPILHLLGAAGNQSPRHTVRANTLAEAVRLGTLLANELERVLTNVAFESALSIDVHNHSVELPVRRFPSVDAAYALLKAAQNAYSGLQRGHGDQTEIRTAECNLFGAEELVTLATAATTGKLAEFAQKCMPAEIQTIRIGSRCYVAWPGEVFFEFALELMREVPEAVLITLANGELQGYLVTEEAVANAWYESGNAIFSSPESAERLLGRTYDLLAGNSVS